MYDPAVPHQRVESPCGRCDDTALNTLELICGDRHGSAVRRIRSYDGLWGGWGESTFCSGLHNYLQSVQFKIESDQRGRDDTAANDSRFTCTSGKTIQAPNGAPWGDWGSWAECSQSTAICGFAIRFEPDVRGGDDTAMNGARFACCSTK
ncbi:unnamed protein product [Rotaria sp. Silwood2]|nr:unnamed protein product [Rotaria sp. Silwood2]